MNPEELMDPNALEVIDRLNMTPKVMLDNFTRFLAMHSNRKYNYLYWHVNTTTAPILVFCNMKDTSITRINDPALCFRVVKILDRKVWRLINSVIGNIFLHNTNKRELNVLRIDYFLQYMKSIKFKMEAIEYKIIDFGTRVVKVKDKEKPISQVVYDVHCQYLMDRLYKAHSPLLTDDDAIDRIEDVTKGFNRPDNKFTFKAFKGKLTVELTNGLDVVSSRLLNYLDVNDEGKWKLEQCLLKGDAFNIVNRLKSPSMTIVSVRVYMYYFLKAMRASSRKKKKAGGK